MTAFNRPSKDHVENILINYKDKISIPQIPTQTDLLLSPNTYEASTGILESIFSKIGLLETGPVFTAYFNKYQRCLVPRDEGPSLVTTGEAYSD